LEKTIRVKKKRLGSFPFVSVVFSITMALFVVGVFGVLILHGAKLTQLIKENLEINIFLKKEASENERTKVNRTLLSKDYISSVNGQPQIQFVSKEDAAKKFIQDTGEDFLKFLGENPLRDAYIIKVKPELYNKSQL
jgi:cell division transport system permease protein